MAKNSPILLALAHKNPYLVPGRYSRPNVDAMDIVQHPFS